MKVLYHDITPCLDTHVFKYDAVDQETDYHPPELSGLPTPTRYRYNLDKDLTEVIRPDGQTVNLDYDSGGRDNYPENHRIPKLRQQLLDHRQKRQRPEHYLRLR